jgi:type VI secretion system protein ImpC
LQVDFSAAGQEPERTQLYRRLVEDTGRGIGAANWSIIAGQYTFARSIDDIRLLGMIGAIASQANAPFLSAADSSLAGCRSLLETPDPKDWSTADDEAGQCWQSLRTSAIATWIGLALPRPLLRLPYGPKTDRIETYDFDEFTRDSHDAYLWGNPALACALLLGQSFLERGWDMVPGDHADIGDLPAHIIERGGEKTMQACAELFLSERAGDALLERGLMPLMSFRNRNAVRVLRVQSMAEPAKALAGRWA